MSNRLQGEFTISNERPIRVGFVVHVMQVAGAEMLVAETVRRLGGRIRPTIFCLDAIGPLGERLRSENIEVVNLERRPGRDYRVAWRMARLIAARRIEVLHAHQYTPFFYAALGKLLTRHWPRLILTEHGRHYPDVVSPTRRAVNRLVLGHLADAITGVCQFSVDGLCHIDGFSPAKITVVENGVDVEHYGPALDVAALRHRLGLDPARLYVVNIARHHPVKDQAALLRAFREVASARADADLLLVGDGPLRHELEIQAEALGISERVKFLGVRSDIPDLLRAADVFALTSVSEAASLTLMEAMATGIPSVVTAVGGNPEIVRDGCEGLLVPRGDSVAIAQAILHLLDNPKSAKSLGLAARSRAQDRYRLNRTIDSYYDLYRRLKPDWSRPATARVSEMAGQS